MDDGEPERGSGGPLRPRVRLRSGLWEVWSILPVEHFYLMTDAMAFAVWVAGGGERAAPILYGSVWETEIRRRIR